MEKLLIFAAFLFTFIVGLIIGGYTHVRVLKDDGTICAEIQ